MSMISQLCRLSVAHTLFDENRLNSHYRGYNASIDVRWVITRRFSFVIFFFLLSAYAIIIRRFWSITFSKSSRTKNTSLLEVARGFLIHPTSGPYTAWNRLYPLVFGLFVREHHLLILKTFTYRVCTRWFFFFLSYSKNELVTSRGV